MAINSNLSTDYSNRKIDIHIFQGVKAPNASDITPSFGKISNFCTGLQKLIQRYTIAILTELGSQSMYPTFGTSFITSLTSKTRLYNQADIYPIFNKANAKVVSEFFNYDQANPGAPDDERLSGARIKKIDLTKAGRVELTVQLETYGASPTTFILPLPI